MPTIYRWEHYCHPDRTPGSGILDNQEALTAGDPVMAQLLSGGNALTRRFDYVPYVPSSFRHRT